MAESADKRLLVAFLIVVALLGLSWCLRIATSGQPIRSATVRLRGSAEPVTVDYDEWGVPSILGPPFRGSVE